MFGQLTLPRTFYVSLLAIALIVVTLGSFTVLSRLDLPVPALNLPSAAVAASAPNLTVNDQPAESLAAVDWGVHPIKISHQKKTADGGHVFFQVDVLPDGGGCKIEIRVWDWKFKDLVDRNFRSEKPCSLGFLRKALLEAAIPTGLSTAVYNNVHDLVMQVVDFLGRP